MLEKLKKSGFGYIIIGIMLIVIGVCFVAFNDSLKVLSISIGILLCVFASVYGTLTIVDTTRGLYFVLKIIFASIALICGVVTAIFNTLAIDIIVATFCLLLIIDASFKLNTAIIAKKVKISYWWVMLALSILIVGGAFFVLKYTPESALTTSVIIGVVLIIDGAANLLSFMYIPHLERRIKKIICREMNQKEG